MRDSSTYLASLDTVHGTALLQITDRWGERSCEISGINRAPRRLKIDRIWTPSVLGALDRRVFSANPNWVFSVSCAGRSRLPDPDQVFSVSCVGRSRLSDPDRVFSVSCAGRFRLPNPDRVFSVFCAGRSRLPDPDQVFSISRAEYSRLFDPDRVFSVPCTERTCHPEM